MDSIELLVQWIKNSKKTVFFGGAGVSTESGLKDFRSVDGLYHESYKYPPEMILSRDFFYSHTKDFFDFYKKKLNVLNYRPNITHYVLKEMEEKRLLSSIITQNIDGFHQEAGSSHVLELHGSVKRNYCLDCHRFYDDHYVFESDGVPHCTCGGIIKPDVVLYQESLDETITMKALKEIQEAELLIVGGTSLNVYPAAGFLRSFQGKHLVLINRDKTPFDDQCDLVIHESIGKVFEQIKKEIS